MPDGDYNFLIELLNDESDNTASFAMSELLRRDPDALDESLRTLQESPEPRMRRRIHQLQAALNTRRKRRLLTAKLEHGKLPLGEGCIQLHLLWFDNDTRAEVIDQLRDLREELTLSAPDGTLTLEYVAAFMAESGYTVPSREDIEPEYFCIGSVLDDRFGSDLIFSALCAILCEGSALKLSVVRRGLDFGVMDSKGNALFPGDSWEFRPAKEMAQTLCKHLSAKEILRFTLSMLFVCALGTDAFRYIHTIGNALAASIGRGSMDFLPYPYGKKKLQ